MERQGSEAVGLPRVLGRVSVGAGSAQATFGRGCPLVAICGPCVIESREHCLDHARRIRDIAAAVGLPLIFKSSYDKANRTSLGGFRGVGLEAGLDILAEVREAVGVSVVTDVHSPEEAIAAAKVVDLLQIPAFLCRQTDLLIAAGGTGKPVMVKKGQFLHPSDMGFAVEKVVSSGQGGVIVCERGACFGYRELVVDFRSLEMLHEHGCPVVFDATHSVQSMGGASGRSGGARQYVPGLARAAAASGVDGVFLECRENPSEGPSDGPNMVSLKDLEPLLEDLRVLHDLRLQTRA